MNRRRKLLLALAASPVALARAQKPGARPMRVATLVVAASDGSNSSSDFVDALRELGWAEGRNVVYDHVVVQPDRGLLLTRAKELVARNPDLVFVRSNGPALAVFAATRTIPIVMSGVANPVEIGLVQSLKRPGGNVTGVTNIGWELGGKRMQLLREILPKISRVGVLSWADPGSGAPQELKLIEQAAGIGVSVAAAVTKPSELDGALMLLAEKRVEAVLTSHITLFLLERKRILSWAGKQRIAVIGHRSELADDGALFSYSALRSDQVRRAAQLADRILKGAKPADIPVEQPTKFELVVNLKTAKALGITIPQSVMLQASRVIE